jgi:predicted transcriptional regulator
MGRKRSTREVIQLVFNSIKSSSKSINEVADEVETSWETAKDSLEFLEKIGKVKSKKEGGKTIFSVLNNNSLVEVNSNTIFNLPLTSYEEKLIDSLFVEIENEWIKQKKVKPNKTQMQKTIFDVAEKQNLDVPRGWYLFGAMCVKHYFPGTQYESLIPLNNSILDQVEESVSKYSECKNTAELKALQYSEYSNKLYQIKEKLSKISKIDFNEKNSSALEEYLLMFAMNIKKTNENEEIIETVNDFVSSLTHLIKHKTELDELREEISEGFSSLWELVGAYNLFETIVSKFNYNRKEYYSYFENRLFIFNEIAKEHINNIECFCKSKEIEDEFDKFKKINIEKPKTLTQEERKKLAEKFSKENTSNIFREFNVN